MVSSNYAFQWALTFTCQLWGCKHWADHSACTDVPLHSLFQPPRVSNLMSYKTGPIFSYSGTSQRAKEIELEHWDVWLVNSTPAVKGLQETALLKHPCHNRGSTVCVLLWKNSGSLLCEDYSDFANLWEHPCLPFSPASFQYSSEYLELPGLTLLGRKKDKSWDTKSCLKSSNLFYSLGKVQGWVLVNAEALGKCFWTSSRLQAWVEATTFAFSMSCESEKCNSVLRHPEFIFFKIFHSISEWTLSLKPKIFTIYFYFTSVHSFSKKTKHFLWKQDFLYIFIF